jgi:hypothetical protein
VFNDIIQKNQKLRGERDRDREAERQRKKEMERQSNGDNITREY